MVLSGQTQLVELSGEAPELMGRSFLRRRAAAVSRVARKTTRAAAPLVRKISHSALNVAAKVPGYGSLVSAAREMQQRPGGPAYNLPAAPSAPGAPDATTPEAPGAGMSTKTKILIGGGVAVAVVGVAIVVAKKKQK